MMKMKMCAIPSIWIKDLTSLPIFFFLFKKAQLWCRNDVFVISLYHFAEIKHDIDAAVTRRLMGQASLYHDVTINNVALFFCALGHRSTRRILKYRLHRSDKNKMPKDFPIWLNCILQLVPKHFKVILH